MNSDAPSVVEEADYRRTFDRLGGIESLLGLEDAKAFHYLACLIDLASRYHDPSGTAKALRWCEELEKRSLSASNEMLLAYYRANAWGDKASERHLDHVEAWRWEQPETINQILSLRKARRHPRFPTWDSVRRAQVLTNLGNQLDGLGRFVEAIPIWNQALEIKPAFGMARGNRGLALATYARALFDPHHRAYFLLSAFRDLEFALSGEADFEGYSDAEAKQSFQQRMRQISRLANFDKLEEQLRLDDVPLAVGGDEMRYRAWALHEGLFLNPLNDLGGLSVAGTDSFVLPSFTTGIGEPPTWLGFFNQLKQEFVSARWFFYEGTRISGPHFSDRDVKLYNTLDYPSYGVHVERVKIAFRMAYSVFDKIAYFLNDYVGLKIPEKQVYFRTVWYVPGKKEIRPEFKELRNWPWRGLYWLSQDFFDEKLSATAEPDALELHRIRNKLEHSYLKLHEMGSGSSPGSLFHDRLAYSLSRHDFQSKTLHVLRLARAALIYLSLGMDQEEARRMSEKGGKAGLQMPMTLDTWDDDWKQ
jgi:tetratricopeptide (TPR) repeat protein